MDVMRLNMEVSVPLKGEARRRRAGRMLALQRKGPKGDCAAARHFICAFEFVLVFNSLFFSISDPRVKRLTDWAGNLTGRSTRTRTGRLKAHDEEGVVVAA
jgi:hypothetical protein